MATDLRIDGGTLADEKNAVWNAIKGLAANETQGKVAPLLMVF